MLRSGRDYKESLRDQRAVYVNGRRVDPVLSVKAFSAPAEEVAANYDRQASGELVLNFEPPRSVAELRAGAELVSRVDGLTMLTLESLKTLHTAHIRLGGSEFEQSEAMAAFAKLAAHENLRIAQCITDAKGDRALTAARQPDADAFLRVVDRTSDGVVIRGAKLHVTAAALSHVLMVMPTKAMKPDEADYAIACAVDTNSAGVHIIDASHTPLVDDDRHYPWSRSRSLPTSTVIFDDVFVPHDRIFLDGQAASAAVFAHSLGLWLRANGTALMADDADRLVGLADLIAEANGTSRVPHVRDKIAEMIIHATSVRAGLEAALANPSYERDGAVAPDELYSNVAKYQAAANYPMMIRHLHDIAGGGVITAPTLGDLDNPAVGALVRKYYTGSEAVDGGRRLRIFHAIRDISADRFGGWQQLVNLHGAGGLHAQRLVSRRRYDMERARGLADDLLYPEQGEPEKSDGA